MSPVHDGILVQSPLPKAMGAGAQQRVFDTIAADKDVDGFGAESVGLLSQNRPKLVACTPAGVIELLEREKNPRPPCRCDRSQRYCREADGDAAAASRCDGDDLSFARLTCPRFVVRPISSSPLSGAGLVTKDFVKPGATVIDVGMNRVTDPAVAAQLFPAGTPLASFHAKGSVLVGDVHPAVVEVAGALTPVPGGVGPLTITMLMMNTLRGAGARGGGLPAR